MQLLLFGMLFLLLNTSDAGPTLATIQTIYQARTKHVRQPLQHRVAKEQRAYHQISMNPYALLLVYRASCPHCRRFDPIVVHYAKAHHLPIYGLTVSMQTFPNIVSKPLTPTLMRQLFGDESRGIKVPSLFLVNTKTKHVFPVSVGEMSLFELNQRMQALMPKVTQYEKQMHRGDRRVN